MTAPDAASVEATIRSADASRVREQLANATEEERRALAKALKPLFRRPSIDAWFRLREAAAVACQL
jgi:hypothetical protein